MTKKYSAHLFSLCWLVILSGVINSNLYHIGFWSFLIGMLTAIAFLFLFKFLLNRKKNCAFLFYLAVFCVEITAILGAISSFLEFFCFLKTVLLPQGNSLLLFSALLLVVLFFATVPFDVLLKYSLLVAVFCAIIIVVCFFSGINNYDTDSFVAFFKPVFNPNGIFLFLQVLVLTVFLNDADLTIKPVFWGVVTGFAATFLCLIQTILTVGLNQDIPFPFLKAVGVISSGSLFTRFDGLVYFLFFAVSILKITVCVKAVVRCVLHTIATKKQTKPTSS